MTTEMIPRFLMPAWGKDHWSMLAYVDCVCVDGDKGVGTIDWARCRVNEKNYPLLKRTPGEWKPEYGTRLSGFFLKDDKTNPKRRIKWHDDVNCLDDMAEEGLVDILSLINGFVKLTAKGSELAGRLRAHKARGGMFFNFDPAATVA